MTVPGTAPNGIEFGAVKARCPTECNILSIYQSGFRKKHSTVTAVLYLVDHILEQIMDKQKLTGAAFIDLKKAFDLVNHKCLLHKLEHYGVREQSLLKMVRKLSDHAFTKSAVRTGLVIQPSARVWCPTGFLVRTLFFVMYADDTVVYFTGSDISTIKQGCPARRPKLCRAVDDGKSTSFK